MPIELVCPNGHRLVAKDTNAGRTGKCPVCKAAVNIPLISQAKITESAIINIMGDPAMAKALGKDAADSGKEGPSPKPAAPSLPTKTATKVCPSCEREIDLGYHICPHCKTYIKGLDGF